MDVVSRPEDVPREQVIAAMHRRGVLSWKLFPHQRKVYDAYRAFEKRVIEGKNNGPPIFILDCARRWGKTFLVLLIKIEDAHRRPGSRHTLATALQDDIGEIIVPLFNEIVEDCPNDCLPEVRTARLGETYGIYFKNGSVIKLVGVDKKPRGLRGKRSDGHAWTEAAFFAELRDPVSRVQHQFQNVPHACLLMESSAPEDPDHEFDVQFIPEAKARGAYVFQTIHDNDQLTTEQKERYFAEAAKVSKENADRELLGIRSRDVARVVIPEWSESYVRAHERPKHAYAISVFDPGWRHLFGALWGYIDFKAQQLVIEDSWAGSNASTARVACVVAARELDLYGTPPPMAMSFIPLESDDRRIGWTEYLRGDRCEHLAEDLYELANMPAEERPDYERRPGHWIRQDRPGQWTHWDRDRSEYMSNPNAHVADVDLRLIGDMRETFGYEFMSTTKQEVRTMVSNTRAWFSSGRIVFLPNSGPVTDHVKLGRWAADRKHFEESKMIGHADLLACLVYATRYAELIQDRDPFPPAEMVAAARDRPGAVVERMPWQQPHPYELEVDRRIEAFEAELAAERGRMRDPVRMRPFK